MGTYLVYQGNIGPSQRASLLTPNKLLH